MTRGDQRSVKIVAGHWVSYLALLIALVSAVAAGFSWWRALHELERLKGLPKQPETWSHQHHHSFIDAIAYAQSIARLDFVTLALTILGVGLVIAAFPTFVIVKQSAEDSARAVAQKCSKDCSQEWIDENGNDEIREQLPILLTKFLGESPRGREILESVINDLYPESDLEFDEETRDVIQTNALTEALDKEGQ